MSSIGPMEGVLGQMRALAGAAAAQPPTHAAAPVRTGGFGAELAKALESVSGAQMNAIQKQQHFALGAKDVQLNDVMIDMQKASLGFQTAVQVRNKLVTAYQTIASMPL